MFRSFWLDLITLILLLLKIIHLRGNSILWKQYFIKTWYLYFYFCSRSAVKENIWNLEIVQRTEIWGYNKQHCLPGLNFPHIECSDCFQTSSLLCGMGEIPSVHGLLTHWSFSTINAFVNLPALLPAWLDPHEPRSLAFPIMCCKTPRQSFLIQLVQGANPRTISQHMRCMWIFPPYPSPIPATNQTLGVTEDILSAMGKCARSFIFLVFAVGL